MAIEYMRPSSSTQAPTQYHNLVKRLRQKLEAMPPTHIVNISAAEPLPQGHCP